MRRLIVKQDEDDAFWISACWVPIVTEDVKICKAIQCTAYMCANVT